MTLRRDLSRIEWKLDRLTDITLKLGANLMSREQDVLDAVNAETDAGQAVVALLDGIAADLAELKAGMDPASAAKLDEALAKLVANKDVYAAAVVRNTPVDPGPVDVPGGHAL